LNNKKNEIALLEDSNAELSKEILLNEMAIYEVDKETEKIDLEILEHEIIQNHINGLNLIKERLRNQNLKLKDEIYENNLIIKKLRNEK